MAAAAEAVFVSDTKGEEVKGEDSSQVLNAELQNSLRKGRLRAFWDVLERRVANHTPLTSELLDELLELSGNNPAVVAMLNFLFDPPRISTVANQMHAFALANVFCLKSYRGLLSKILALDSVDADVLHAIAICAIENHLPEMLQLVINHPKYNLQAAVLTDSSNPLLAILTKQKLLPADNAMLGMLITKLREQREGLVDLYTALAQSSYASYAALIDPCLTQGEITQMKLLKSFPQSSTLRVVVPKADLFVTLRKSYAEGNWLQFYNDYAKLSRDEKRKLLNDIDRTQHGEFFTVVNVDLFSVRAQQYLDRDSTNIVLAYLGGGAPPELRVFLEQGESEDEILERQYRQRVEELQELKLLLERMSNYKVAAINWLLAIRAFVIQPIMVLGLFAPLGYFSYMTDVIKDKFFEVARVCTQLFNNEIFPVMPTCELNATRLFTDFPFVYESVTSHGVSTSSYTFGSDNLCSRDASNNLFFIKNMPAGITNPAHGYLQDIVQNKSEIDALCDERFKYIMLIVFVGILIVPIVAGNIMGVLRLIGVDYEHDKVDRFPGFWQMTFGQFPGGLCKQTISTMYQNLNQGSPISAEARLSDLREQIVVECNPDNKPQMLSWLSGQGSKPRAQRAQVELDIAELPDERAGLLSRGRRSNYGRGN